MAVTIQVGVLRHKILNNEVLTFDGGTGGNSGINVWSWCTRLLLGYLAKCVKIDAGVIFRSRDDLH